MNRKNTNTPSKQASSISSSSFHINAVLNNDLNNNNYSISNHQYSNPRQLSPSSSGDLSSNMHGYGSEPLLKIVRPPSYASMLYNHNNINNESSSSDTNHHNNNNNEPSRLSSIYSVLVSPFKRFERKTSIYGPTGTKQERLQFFGIISLMTFCGANNDFLGKLCYQSLPGIYNGYQGLYNRYWIAWLLTFGTFIVCSLAIIFGWNQGKEWKNFKLQHKQFMFNVSIPGNIFLYNYFFLLL